MFFERFIYKDKEPSYEPSETVEKFQKSKGLNKEEYFADKKIVTETAKTELSALQADLGSYVAIKMGGGLCQNLVTPKWLNIVSVNIKRQ